MVTDGFTTSDPEHKAVSAILSQNPKVTKVVVGRLANAMTHVETVDFSAFVANTTTYSLTIDGSAASFTSDATATAAEISAGMKLAIDALSKPVTVTDNLAGLLTITATVPGALFTLETDRSLMKRENTTADAGIVADLTAIKNENNDWYTVHLTSQSKNEVVAAAVFVETLIKQMIVSSADDDILDVGVTTDIASVLKAANQARTSTMFHEKPHQYAGAAWAGKVLPTDPGSATWKFKTLASVTTSVLTDTEKANAATKNANVYVTEGGVSITQEGKASSGEFIDITLFVDWLRSRLEERIFGRLVGLGKIPFDDPGIAIIESEIRAQLDEGIGLGGLAALPDPTVTVPLAADVSAVDKASRTLTGVSFSATLAGAIHKLTINGTVSV